MTSEMRCEKCGEIIPPDVTTLILMDKKGRPYFSCRRIKCFRYALELYKDSNRRSKQVVSEFERRNLAWDIFTTVALEVTIGAALLAFIALIVLFFLPVVILW